MNDSRISNLVPVVSGRVRNFVHFTVRFEARGFGRSARLRFDVNQFCPAHCTANARQKDAMRALAQLASLAASAPDRRTARAPTGHTRVLARARAPKKWARIVAPASALLAASPRAPASRGRHRIAVHASDGSGDGRATRWTSATTRQFLDGTFETAPTLVSVATGITHPPTADFSNQKTSRRAGA